MQISRFGAVPQMGGVRQLVSASWRDSSREALIARFRLVAVTCALSGSQPTRVYRFTVRAAGLVVRGLGAGIRAELPSAWARLPADARTTLVLTLRLLTELQTVMAIFPCAWPPSRWHIASGTSESGYVLATISDVTGRLSAARCFKPPVHRPYRLLRTWFLG